MPTTVTEPFFPKLTSARQPSVNYSHTEFHENAENSLVGNIKSRRDRQTRSLHKAFLALERTPKKDSTRILIMYLHTRVHTPYIQLFISKRHHKEC